MRHIVADESTMDADGAELGSHNRMIFRRNVWTS
jgi:hypothetical protein